MFLAQNKTINLGLVVASVLPFLAMPGVAFAAASISRASLPLSFEQNEGQAAPRVKFISRGASGLLLLSSDEITLRAPGQPDRLRLKLTGAAPTSISGTGEASGTVNYLLGNQSSKWLTNIPSFTQVTYKNIYPQIDLIVYGRNGQFESDFVVARNADPSAISLHIDGKLQLGTDGSLNIKSVGGAFQIHNPFVYQLAANGERTAVDCRYTVNGNKVGFALGSYDHAKSLVIDPVLAYATYLGGTGSDQILSIRTDASGNVYVAGQTTSTNFPTSTPTLDAAEKGSIDCFVSKFDPTGQHLIYSTFLGGSLADSCSALGVNASGEAFVAGTTSSTNFPTVSPIQSSLKTGPGGTSNGFVAELDCTGSHLIFSTYLGGGGEFVNDLALDLLSNVYVVGVTDSGNFPVTKGAYQTTCGGGSAAGCPILAAGAATDAFLTKISPVGCLIYSTYLGGSSFDSAFGVAVDLVGSAYVTGQVDSVDFPTTKGAYQPKNAGINDAFVTKFSPSGSSVIYSTYLGGAAIDSGNSIAVDLSGNAYVAGSTMSTNFPIVSAFQSALKNPSATSAFVSKLNATGSALVYSTYIGGSTFDYPFHITVDPTGTASATGITFSSDFTTKSAFQSTYGGDGNAFIVNFSTTGTLNYSTYLGGSGGDYGKGIYADPINGGLWVGGYTYSTNFPVTSNAYQKTNKSLITDPKTGATAGTGFFAKIQ